MQCWVDCFGTDFVAAFCIPAFQQDFALPGLEQSCMCDGLLEVRYVLDTCTLCLDSTNYVWRRMGHEDSSHRVCNVGHWY